MRDLPIYLDYHATTPVDPRVFEAMRPYFCEAFGNASSRSHPYGWRADAAVGDARLAVLQLIGAKSPDEIVFTSGATESNNLAIRGVVEARGGGHIITTAIEHPCVLETCRRLAGRGVDVTVVDVGPSGVVSAAAIAAAVRPDTALISVMAVNNEVGTIQPIAEIGAIAREAGAALHCDAAQAVGRIPIDVRRLGVDLLSISAHKIYGPKGAGALYVRRGRGAPKLAAQQTGGGQERGARSGTLNVPGIVGLGAAARLANTELEPDAARARRLRDRLLARLRAHVPDLRIHGCLERRVAGNLNVAFGEVPGDAFINAVSGIAVSGGAACSSGKAAGSHVLRAMGLSQAEANRAVRVAVGRMTSEAEIDRAAALMIDAAARLR